MSKMGFRGLFWYIFGDFNAVKNCSERKGVSQIFNDSKHLGFQQLINDLNLVDLPVLGKEFTWFKLDGSAMSRLDMFRLYESWISLWSLSALWVSERDISDHCPIMLKGEVNNWGPKPFRFNNCWLQHCDFKPFVEKSLSELHVSGWKIFGFKEKLKLLKLKLKEWNVELFGFLDEQIAKFVAGLNESNDKEASLQLNDEDQRSRWKIMMIFDMLRGKGTHCCVKNQESGG